jgi:drug/metabolite transporter (DMT)-like permease
VNKGLISWLLFILLSLTWGSSFILMKRGLEVYNSEQVASLRMVFAFLFMLPFAFYHFKNAAIKANWKWYLSVGLFGNFIPAFLFTKAQTGISSSMAGILNALTPLFTLIVGAAAFKGTFSKQQIVGVIVGLTGAVFLLVSRDSKQVNPNLLLGWLVVLATFCYAISVNIIKHKLSGVNSIAITAFAFCGIGLPALLNLFNSDFIFVTTINPKAFKALIYLAILGFWGTAVAVILYNILIKETSILFASSVTYFIPVVALAWGVFDGEAVYFAQFICIAIIILGVYLVNFRRSKI